MSCIKQGNVGELTRYLKEDKDNEPRYNNYEQNTESVWSFYDYNPITPNANP